VLRILRVLAARWKGRSDQFAMRIGRLKGCFNCACIGQNFFKLHFVLFCAGWSKQCAPHVIIPKPSPHHCLESTQVRSTSSEISQVSKSIRGHAHHPCLVLQSILICGLDKFMNLVPDDGGYNCLDIH
jgi:hypothetical protein